MIDIRRENMFPKKVFVLDHITPLTGTNLDYIKDIKLIEKILSETLDAVKKTGQYNHYVFYAALDGWEDLFDNFINNHKDVIPVTGNLQSSDKWVWFPHWQVVVDATVPLPTTKKTPNFRWQYWVRRPRLHRIILLSEIAKLDIAHGDIIFPHHLKEPTGRVFPPTEELFEDKNLYYKISKQFNPPIDIPIGENGAYTASYEARQDRAIDVVTETMWQRDGGTFLSEKTYKAIRAGQLFFILGQKHSIKYLREYGFKTFDKWIDHSYDDEDDFILKAKLIAKEIKRISMLEQDQFEKMWHETYEDRLHNQLYKRHGLKFWKNYLKKKIK